jgi:hypothetical protein
MGRENRTGLFEMPRNPDEADLFLVQLRQLALSLRTHTVCEVKTYNPATQTATVTVDILQVVADNSVQPSASNPSPTKTRDPRVLKDIPVAWPRTSSGYLTFPLNPGDKGELHVQDRSLDAWLALGQATDPIAAWTHELADSVFHPHIFNTGNPITPPTNPTATVLHGNTLIFLGALANAPVLRGTEVMAAFTTYTAAIAAAPIDPVGFIAAVKAATAALALTIATWPSKKTFTE